jgi:hypothetical protein
MIAFSLGTFHRMDGLFAWIYSCLMPSPSSHIIFTHVARVTSLGHRHPLDVFEIIAAFIPRAKITSLKQPHDLPRHAFDGAMDRLSCYGEEPPSLADDRMDDSFRATCHPMQSVRQRKSGYL